MLVLFAARIYDSMIWLPSGCVMLSVIFTVFQVSYMIFALTHRLTILMGVREVTPLLRTHGFWQMELQMTPAPYTLQRMKHAMRKISVVIVPLAVAALL